MDIGDSTAFEGLASDEGVSLRSAEGDDDEGGDEEGDEAYCGDPLCGRRFPHEHVSPSGASFAKTSLRGAEVLPPNVFQRV